MPNGRSAHSGVGQGLPLISVPKVPVRFRVNCSGSGASRDFGPAKTSDRPRQYVDRLGRAACIGQIGSLLQRTANRRAIITRSVLHPRHRPLMVA